MAQLQTGGGKGNLATAVEGRDTNLKKKKKKNYMYQMDLKSLWESCETKLPTTLNLLVVSPDSGLLKGVW